MKNNLRRRGRFATTFYAKILLIHMPFVREASSTINWERRKRRRPAWKRPSSSLRGRARSSIATVSMLMAEKKFAVALPIMQRVVALKPDHAKAYHCIGLALKETGDLAGALAAFDKSLEINPQDADVLNDKGNTLNDIGRPPEAAACYEQALILKPDHHLLMNNLGVVRFLQNDLDGAEALYQTVLAIQPEYPDSSQ